MPLVWVYGMPSASMIIVITIGASTLRTIRSRSSCCCGVGIQPLLQGRDQYSGLLHCEIDRTVGICNGPIVYENPDLRFACSATLPHPDARTVGALAL